MVLNLVQHRAGPNVWERVGQHDWDVERYVTAAAAGMLVAAGLRRRSVGGLLMMLGGTALAWWASAGADERSQWREQARAALPPRRPKVDPVGEASEESFPASDPPAFTVS